MGGLGEMGSNFRGASSQGAGFVRRVPKTARSLTFDITIGRRERRLEARNA